MDGPQRGKPSRSLATEGYLGKTTILSYYSIINDRWKDFQGMYDWKDGML